MKQVKIPGPEHPITIEPWTDHLTIKVANQVIADTHDALVLREASYPPVFYIPRADIDMTKLLRTEHSTYCPYKGDCAYYSVPSGGERSINAAWTYESPYPSVAAIAGHLAFYADRIDAV